MTGKGVLMTAGYQGTLSDEPSSRNGHRDYAPEDQFHAGIPSRDPERDLRQRQEILEKLGAYPDLDTTRVDVAVENGFVTLRGEAVSLDEKETLAAIVGNLPHVTDVVNFLKVRQGPGTADGNGLHAVP